MNSNEIKSMSNGPVCKKCEQDVPAKCDACNQYIMDSPDDEDCCSECGQELPEQEDEEFVQQKDGTERPICHICKRPRQECPECEREFDTEDDDEEEESDNETDDEESDEENDEEETARHEQKGKGRKRFNF